MNVQRLITIVNKVKYKGLAWAYSRAMIEIKSPTFRPLIRFRKNIAYIMSEISKMFRRNVRDDGGACLTVIYDLSFNPITYDFCFFLAGAELFARQHNRRQFFLWIVLRGPTCPTDEIYNQVVDKNSVNWRISNIIIPMMSLCPACKGYAVVPEFSDILYDINGDITFPEYYSFNFRPKFSYYDFFLGAKKDSFSGLRATLQGINYIDKWKKSNAISDRMVTITIRQYGYDSSRDSNIVEWVRFARLIAKEGYTPVFLPDVDTSFDIDRRFDDLVVFKEPCWNLGLRMALYEKAYVNLFVSSGPAALAQVNMRVRYICMKMVVEESIQAIESVYRDRGLEIGLRKYEFASDYQVLSWRRDDFDNICDEFYAFVNRVDGK